MCSTFHEVVQTNLSPEGADNSLSPEGEKALKMINWCMYLKVINSTFQNNTHDIRFIIYS